MIIDNNNSMTSTSSSSNCGAPRRRIGFPNNHGNDTGSCSPNKENEFAQYEVYKNGNANEGYDNNRDINCSYDNDGSLSPNHKSKNSKKRSKKRRSKRTNSNDYETPFHILCLQVGVVVFLVGLSMAWIYQRFNPRPAITFDSNNQMDDDDDYVDSQDTEEINSSNDYNSNKFANYLSYFLNMDNHGNKLEEELEKIRIQETPQQPTPPPTPPPPPVEETAPPLPKWELGYQSNFDPYAIAQRYHSNDNSKNSLNDFWNITENVRTEFSNLYGGEHSARALLERALSTFGTNSSTGSTGIQEEELQLPNDLIYTACRIQQKVANKHKTNYNPDSNIFKMVFGGYSVTNGRGNYFYQSFPFVLEKILKEPFQSLGIQLSVSNAAIGGCPAFPYGWCMNNFFGTNPDVISWDFSMNEAGGIQQGLESYIRQMMTTFFVENISNIPPKLIVKDTYLASKRRELLQKYVQLQGQGGHSNNQQQLTIHDPVVLHTEPAIKPFLDRKEEFRPIGFRNWRKFGSPVGAPGQALHHPAVQEHIMLGWILSMHFLSALELVAAAVGSTTDSKNPSFHLPCPNEFYKSDGNTAADNKETRQFSSLSRGTSTNVGFLPPPITEFDGGGIKELNSIFFGEAFIENGTDMLKNNTNSNANSVWKMNRINCRTSFEPIVNGDLTDIVVSGSIGEDIDIRLPKSHMYYNKGWVLDLSDSEKDAKRKLDRFGGLGFIDSKKAYYGLYSSGNLTLFLPHNNNKNNFKDKQSKFKKDGMPKADENAKDFFKLIVICQVNEKRVSASCVMDKDVTYIVGGIPVSNGNNNIQMIDYPGSLYLGQKICSYVKVPMNATLTSRANLLQEQTKITSTKKRQLRSPLTISTNLTMKERIAEHNNNQVEEIEDEIGLSVQLFVHNHHIMKREHACSISHVIWEESQ